MEIDMTTSDAGVAPEFIAEFGQRYLAAWNSHEPERLLALMTDDIEYRDDAGHR